MTEAWTVVGEAGGRILFRPPGWVSPCGRYQLLFEGRLYNSRELQEQLGEPTGGPPPVDAELLLAAFVRWGPACAHRLNGMFAFVVWDGEARQLHAVRDRFGLKPLYLYADAARVALSPSIRQLLALPAAKARLNVRGAIDFLVAGATDQGPSTLFEGVLRVPPGAALQLDFQRWAPGDSLPEFQPWYTLPAPGSLNIEEPEAVERFRQLLIDAVRLQWRHPGPVGLCLSGGLDSSAIAGIVSRECDRGEELATFKVCFGDPRFDELELLEGVLAMTGMVNHRSHATFLDVLSRVEAAVEQVEEPFGRASLIAQWMLCEQAAGLGIKATLDGQGSDEQLGGYASMAQAHRARLAQSQQVGVQSFVSARAMGALGGAPHLGWLSPYGRQLAAERERAQTGSPEVNLGTLCRQRMTQGDLPMMMRYNDCIGRAHGIEARVPFMDHRLVELSIALGDRFKIHGEETKYLLRRAAADYLPDVVLAQHRKGSYSALEAGWLRGPQRTVISEAVVETARQWPLLFDEAAVRELARAPEVAEKDTLMLLWRIFCFGVWARRFL